MIWLQNKKTLLESPEHVEKNRRSIEQYLTELRPFEVCIYMVKNGFFWNNKNIGIWILRKEQNLFRSEFYMCVQSSVKIDREMPVKNPRWPPRNLVFLHLIIRLRWFPAHHRDCLVFFLFIHFCVCVCVSVYSRFSRPFGIRLGYPLAQMCFSTSKWF